MPVYIKDGNGRLAFKHLKRRSGGREAKIAIGISLMVLAARSVATGAQDSVMAATPLGGSYATVTTGTGAALSC